LGQAAALSDTLDEHPEHTRSAICLCFGHFLNVNIAISPSPRTMSSTPTY